MRAAFPAPAQGFTNTTAVTVLLILSLPVTKWGVTELPESAGKYRT
jgi:hypothetical protein